MGKGLFGGSRELTGVGGARRGQGVFICVFYLCALTALQFTNIICSGKLSCSHFLLMA